MESSASSIERIFSINQLPSFLAAYNDGFEWDIKLLKILLDKYINEILLFNKREDYWLANGLQSYLMIKYVEKFYPEVKAIGNISKIWGSKKHKKLVYRNGKQTCDTRCTITAYNRQCEELFIKDKDPMCKWFV